MFPLTSGLLSLIAAYQFSFSYGTTSRESIIFPENESLSSNEYSLKEYLYSVSSNDSDFSHSGGSDSAQVDCLGLGSTVASTLTWFFMSKPNGTNALDVKFYLSSRKQPRRSEILLGNQFGLEWTDFQIDRKTVIIVHGFLASAEESWIRDMERAFLLWDDVNVLIVDWSSGGNTWNYYKAVLNCKVVGYQIAELLKQIENASIAQGVDSGSWPPLHLVGHSLGAHICGFVAKELRKMQSRYTVGRITALDPAQPCFRNADPSVKLHKSDAEFIDVIHTNGKLLSQIGLGLPEPIGHVDFYPNGGRIQPGCSIDSAASKMLQLSPKKIRQAICSHGRSYVYLTESLISAVRNNCTFWAHYWDLSYRNLRTIIAEPCDENSCIEMGINAVRHPHRGTFFAATSNTVPFCTNGTMVTSEAWALLQQEYAGETKD